ncbi:MAG: AraC family transcriptional regulator [Bacteroidales bacterium]|nr:AraC family transcriptional regulator [Candidatus Latescibacterota bacterium]
MKKNVSAPTGDRSSELARLVGSIAVKDGLFETLWPGLLVSRISTPLPRQPVPYRSSLCVVVQGQKQIFLGERVYTYDPLQYLLVPIALPLEMEVTRATQKKPILGLGLDLDLPIISELLLNIDDSPPPLPMCSQAQPALFVSRTSPTLQDALIRLLSLLADPADLRILGPSIVREILYRVLQGEQGGQLRHLVLRSSNSHQIAGITRFLNENFSERLSIDDIARVAGMSTSALHHNFREVTSMSPLQYLKKIRLHHSRTLMVAHGLNASEAGFQVGYSNPSQFNREFKRLFGLPPGKLLKKMSESE